MKSKFLINTHKSIFKSQMRLFSVSNYYNTSKEEIIALLKGLEYSQYKLLNKIYLYMKY